MAARRNAGRWADAVSTSTESGPESAGDYRPWRLPVGKPMERGDTETRRRRAEGIITGLPADLMALCVADIAEAVIAMLLAGESAEPDDDADTSSNLR